MSELKLPAAIGAVAAGGALGTLTRYGLGELFPHIWTTLVINVVGSLTLGILAELLVHDKGWYLFLGTGFCGGFTTFSLFAVHAITESPIRSILYVLGTLIPAILAAALGKELGERWMRIKDTGRDEVSA
ncbi:CrcB family protein [Rhodococcus sp. IEGM 1379]|uniref:fluoride efflux transporter FluC n=1 Tax=Rhodococcus sp. IEGM 1379 TaxID=3047086 RepID=UPI0024B6BDEC|nr:CrcB family protein [Rhodococcus sp. IEGM 1379]MDI9917939.1 CrcB family protein [Rhodococcus sp. IEGM 1379]